MNTNNIKEVGTIIGCKKPSFETMLRSVWMSTHSFADEFKYIKAYYDDESLIKELNIYNKVNNQMALNLSMRHGDKEFFKKIIDSCSEPVDLVYLTPNRSSFYDIDLIIEVAKIIQDKDKNHIFNFRLKDKKFFIYSVISFFDLDEEENNSKFSEFLKIMKVKQRSNHEVELKVFMKMDFDFLLDFFEKNKYSKKESSLSIKSFLDRFSEDSFSGVIREKFLEFSTQCEYYNKKIILEDKIPNNINKSKRMKI